jgi:uncharacterized protein YgbK (DUF1537 family)
MTGASPPSIIGDDLTGVAEVAAVFATPARPVPLRLRARSQRPVRGLGPDAVDLNTRDAPASQVAYRYARAAACACPGADLYVKIDSALRGPIREALGAVMDAMPDRPMICAPAFPDMGRVVRGGAVRVDGAALADSGLWHHERAAAPVSIADVLPREPDAILDSAAIRRGELRPWLGDGGRLIVCDAETESDLARIFDAGHGAVRRPVWVGSAGLARAAVPGPSTCPPLATPFLAVVGSASGRAYEQAEALRVAGVRCFSLGADELVQETEDERSRVATSIAHAAARENVIVSISPEPGEPRPISRARRARIAHALARAVRPAMETTALAVLVGGATARAVLMACAMHRLEVVGELHAGVVASLAVGRRRLQVVTKSGSFGHGDVLVELLGLAGAGGGG